MDEDATYGLTPDGSFRPEFSPGDRVRMNAKGRELFDQSGKAEGLLLRIEGGEGNVAWEIGQDTRISLSCIECIPAPSSNAPDRSES